MPDPEVEVTMGEPQIQVEDAQAQLQQDQQDQQDTSNQDQQQANVQVERAEPEVTVQMQEPEIQVSRASSDQQQGQQQAAASQQSSSESQQGSESQQASQQQSDQPLQQADQAIQDENADEAQSALQEARQTIEQPAQQQSEQQADQQQLGEQDRTFAMDAAEAGMLEVRLGELAGENGESQNVKDFGQKMVDDHTQANDQLKEIAQQKQIELPQELSEEGQQHVQDLQQLSGAEFDREYTNLMVADHQKVVDLFEQQASDGQDQELVTFAEDTLPTLQEHLDQARQTQQQVVADAVQGDGSGQGATADGQQAAVQQDESEQQAASGANGSGSADQIMDLVGNDVLNDQGDAIGEIQDVVIDDQQNAYAIISVGGFLGLGEKEVALPIDDLQPGAEGEGLMTPMTENDLESLPSYQGELASIVQR
jgi:putative membrane protein